MQVQANYYGQTFLPTIEDIPCGSERLLSVCMCVRVCVERKVERGNREARASKGQRDGIEIKDRPLCISQTLARAHTHIPQTSTHHETSTHHTEFTFSPHRHLAFLATKHKFRDSEYEAAYHRGMHELGTSNALKPTLRPDACLPAALSLSMPHPPFLV